MKIFKSVRKKIAPPTKVFEYKKDKLIKKSIDLELSELEECQCDDFRNDPSQNELGYCYYCGKYNSAWELDTELQYEGG